MTTSKTETNSSPESQHAVGSQVDRGVRPVAWTLRAELDARQSTYRAHLWFSDPVNSSWAPLYDQAAIDAAVAAERERCDELTDDMLRYAMAAMGTGSPADADKFRRFWRFAIEARNTRA